MLLAGIRIESNVQKTTTRKRLCYSDQGSATGIQLHLFRTICNNKKVMNDSGGQGVGRMLIIDIQMVVRDHENLTIKSTMLLGN
jgi:hypothetical protein